MPSGLPQTVARSEQVFLTRRLPIRFGFNSPVNQQNEYNCRPFRSSWIQNDTRCFPVVFGRDETADVSLTSVLVSRRHCEIVQTETGLVLRDLGSVNGTIVNGVPVDEHVLQSGDQLKIGTDVFDVNTAGEVGSFRRGRKAVFGSVARMLKSLGRERVSS